MKCKMPAFAVLMFALLLAGCATTATQTQKTPNVNLSGYPPDFRDGYLDGCASVGAVFKKRDDERFNKKGDRQYKQGWLDGYSICQSQQKK